MATASTNDEEAATKARLESEIHEALQVNSWAQAHIVLDQVPEYLDTAWAKQMRAAIHLSEGATLAAYPLARSAYIQEPENAEVIATLVRCLGRIDGELEVVRLVHHKFTPAVLSNSAVSREIAVVYRRLGWLSRAAETSPEWAVDSGLSKAYSRQWGRIRLGIPWMTGSRESVEEDEVLNWWPTNTDIAQVAEVPRLPRAFVFEELDNLRWWLIRDEGRLWFLDKVLDVLFATIGFTIALLSIATFQSMQTLKPGPIWEGPIAASIAVALVAKLSPLIRRSWPRSMIWVCLLEALIAVEVFLEFRDPSHHSIFSTQLVAVGSTIAAWPIYLALNSIFWNSRRLRGEKSFVAAAATFHLTRASLLLSNYKYPSQVREQGARVGIYIEWAARLVSKSSLFTSPGADPRLRLWSRNLQWQAARGIRDMQKVLVAAEEVRHTRRPVSRQQNLEGLRQSLRQEVRALVLGNYGDLIMARDPAPVPRSLRRLSLEVSRVVAIAATPAIAVWVFMASVGLTESAAVWARTIALIWSVLTLLISLDPSLKDKVALVKSVLEIRNQSDSIASPSRPVTQPVLK